MASISGHNNKISDFVSSNLQNSLISKAIKLLKKIKDNVLKSH